MGPTLSIRFELLYEPSAGNIRLLHLCCEYASPNYDFFADCIQDLADLVRVDGAVGGGGGEAAAALRGASMGSGETSETHHVAAARGMALALTALQGLLQHLALMEDSSNNGTFSLTIGKVLNSSRHCRLWRKYCVLN